MKTALFTLIASLITASASSAAQLPEEKFQLLKLELILSTRNFTLASSFACENQNSRTIQQRVLTAASRAQKVSFNESVRSGKPGSTAMISSVKMEGTDDGGANYSLTLEMPRTKLSALSHPELTGIQIEMKDIGNVVCTK